MCVVLLSLEHTHFHFKPGTVQWTEDHVLRASDLQLGTLRNPDPVGVWAPWEGREGG